MAEFELPEQDRITIQEILKGYKSEGVETPLLPMNVDITGDGICDAWGLDENDEVVLVEGESLKDTVYVSDGDDIQITEDD